MERGGKLQGSGIGSLMAQGDVKMGALWPTK